MNMSKLSSRKLTFPEVPHKAQATKAVYFLPSELNMRADLLFTPGRHREVESERL